MSVTLTFNAERREAYRQQGFWGDASLGDYWSQTAQAMPDKIAVVDNHGDSYTYAVLDSAASRLATWLLACGIQPGDRVAFQLPGWCEFTLIYLACLKTGAVSVPLLPAWREAELVWVLNKCQAKIFFAPTLFKQTRPVDLILPLQNQLPHLQQIVAVDKLAPATDSLPLSQLLLSPPLTRPISVHADELAAVLFTSGTEGMPKGVMLTHNNILASERAYCARLNLTWLDVFLMPAPLGHATGFLHGVTAPFLIGARSVLLDIFTPAACLELLVQQRCTCVLGATPFVYDMLCSVEKHPYDLSSLRFFLCGGTTIPKKIARDCQQLGIKLLSVYGSTESSPHAVVNLDDSLSRMMNTDGYAAAGVEIKVVDEARNTLPAGMEGEEASRGPNVFMGYLDEPELTARALDNDGWYYSGDLCRMDDAGYIKITGRKKDIIVRGGENISSREVEDILLQHPHIHDACVVAMPDVRLGERSCAYVVLKPPHHSLSLESVVTFFSRKRVAKYKYPEHIVIVEKLPRTASGKVQKYQLRQDIIQRLSVESVAG
ncbi:MULTISPECIES: medium-chain fatty-acid--CoA ligase [Citrobacter]|uniref:Cyclohexanecarboxylate-CoA ligase n=1 Tax=Citrobacter pasteurii TaxID=1563222 RepID=A0A6N6K5Q2_9ENTR|nr:MULTISPECIES: medium-chain fatty-acid--CoA ligase [Citrobacter]EIQ80716.1 short-chain-fatty-acid--CoA ligase [Shigella flexneri 1235-66]KAA1278481.1 cyclohexanecarboxylate-CoA ligase [Citrobacter pasteurii]MBA4711909.1 medium-chain fatty-acid--CoA ligase [Citrobacter pasteurii]MBA7943887.1 medium-chain fatty-acid--CoA ligase [Citrobacter sp. RHBSTW-00271]MBD0803445.1 medium-chain fatty-acid--CoA ligase [Citrobacter sp. C6_1]